MFPISHIDQVPPRAHAVVFQQGLDEVSPDVYVAETQHDLVCLIEELEGTGNGDYVVLRLK